MKVQVTARARSDIAAALQTSFDQFGWEAMLRYEALIERALSDLEHTAQPIGSRAIGMGDIRAYHIRNSRRRANSGAVRNPRHLLLYREAAPDLIVVLRVLHDAMSIETVVNR